MDPFAMVLADFNTMLTTTATPEQVSEAEERIQELILENQKLFIQFVMQILSDMAEENLIVQCFIYLRKIFRPTRNISRELIFSSFYEEYADIREDLDSLYCQHIFSESLPIRVNCASAFAYYLNSTIEKNHFLSIYQQILSTARQSENPNYDDGILRLTYESNELHIFEKDRFEGYLGGILEISEKWITYAANNDEFDMELLKSALNCFNILLPLAIETMKFDDYSHIRFYINIAPLILPKCDIYSYDLILRTFYNICTKYYGDSDKFFSELYSIALIGLGTEGEFLESTLSFWKKLANFEFDDIKTHFRDHLPGIYFPVLCSPKPSMILPNYQPKDLINLSLGTTESIDGFLLQTLLGLLRPPDDYPVDYVDSQNESTIFIKVAKTLTACIPLNPELVESHIFPFIHEKISSDSWQDVYSALLAIQAVVYKYTYGVFYQPISLFYDVLTDILATDIPILVGTASVVLSNVIYRYKARINIGHVAKILETFQSPTVHSSPDVFKDYTTLIRSAVCARVTLSESEPFVEFVSKVLLPMRVSEPEKIQYLDYILVDTRHCIPHAQALHVFEQVEAAKQESGALPIYSYYVLALYAKYVQPEFQEASLKMCKKILEDFVMAVETDPDSLDALEVNRFLTELFECESFCSEIIAFGEPLMYFFQRCFQAGNPFEIKFCVRSLGNLIYVLKETNDYINEAIDAVITYVKESQEEILMIYEPDMIAALGRIVDGLRENIKEEHVDAIYEILQERYMKEIPDREMSKEERKYLTDINTAIFKGLTGFIRGVGEQAKQPDFVKEMKYLLTKYIRKNVRDSGLYDDYTLIAFFKLDKHIIETIGNPINIQAYGRAVCDMVKIGLSNESQYIREQAQYLADIIKRL